MGYVFIALYAKLNGFDLYADPVGWVLVLVGVHRLPIAKAARNRVLGLAVLALVVSVPLAVPSVTEWLDDAEPALAWAINLPEFGFSIALAHVLAVAALAAQDKSASSWLRILVTFGVLVAIAPVVIFGGGVSELAAAAGVAVQLFFLMIIWQLFLYSGRPWAQRVLV